MIKKERDNLEKEYNNKRVDTTAEENELKKKIEKAKQINTNDYEKHKNSVIQMLTNRILKVDLELQRNVVADYSSLVTKH